MKKTFFITLVGLFLISILIQQNIKPGFLLGNGLHTTTKEISALGVPWYINDSFGQESENLYAPTSRTSYGFPFAYLSSEYYWQGPAQTSFYALGLLLNMLIISTLAFVTSWVIVKFFPKKV